MSCLIDLFFDGLDKCFVLLFFELIRNFDVLVGICMIMIVCYDGLIWKWIIYVFDELGDMWKEVGENFCVNIVYNLYEFGSVFV